MDAPLTTPIRVRLNFLNGRSKENVTDVTGAPPIMNTRLRPRGKTISGPGLLTTGVPLSEVIWAPRVAKASTESGPAVNWSNVKETSSDGVGARGLFGLGTTSFGEGEDESSAAR
jgi:hypothetical protein